MTISVHSSTAALVALENLASTQSNAGAAANPDVVVRAEEGYDARLGEEGYVLHVGSRGVALRAGDGRYAASPRIDSLHQVWFELHQDLLLTLGRERGAWHPVVRDGRFRSPRSSSTRQSRDEPQTCSRLPEQ